MPNRSLSDKARNLVDLNSLLLLINKVKLQHGIGRNESITQSQLRGLFYYGNKSSADRRYNTFFIKKKSGGVRTISAPCPLLKDVQRCLVLIFKSLFSRNSWTYGFVDGLSVADNAKKHVGMRYVLNIDLENFFPSISSFTLQIYLKQFFNAEIAKYIALLCCVLYWWEW